MFWGLWAIDRELVFPAKLDEVIPVWANHMWVSGTNHHFVPVGVFRVPVIVCVFGSIQLFCQLSWKWPPHTTYILKEETDCSVRLHLHAPTLHGKLS